MTAYRLTLTQRCDSFDLWILFLIAVPLHVEHEWLKWNIALLCATLPVALQYLLPRHGDTFMLPADLLKRFEGFDPCYLIFKITLQLQHYFPGNSKASYFFLHFTSRRTGFSMRMVNCSWVSDRIVYKPLGRS